VTKLSLLGDSPAGSDGSLVCGKPLRLVSDLTDLIVDSQSTLQEALSSCNTCGVVLSCHHVGCGVDKVQESEMEENIRSGFDMIEYTRSCNVGARHSSNCGSSWSTLTAALVELLSSPCELPSVLLAIAGACKTFA
jgi:hypothetical protein